MAGRRKALSVISLSSIGLLLASPVQSGKTKEKSNFRFCLDTSTISGLNKDYWTRDPLEVAKNRIAEDEKSALEKID